MVGMRRALNRRQDPTVPPSGTDPNGTPGGAGGAGDPAGGGGTGADSGVGGVSTPPISNPPDTGISTPPVVSDPGVSTPPVVTPPASDPGGVGSPPPVSPPPQTDPPISVVTPPVSQPPSSNPAPITSPPVSVPSTPVVPSTPAPSITPTTSSTTSPLRETQSLPPPSPTDIPDPIPSLTMASQSNSSLSYGYTEVVTTRDGVATTIIVAIPNLNSAPPGISPGRRGGIIAGSAIGGVFLILAALAVVFCCRRRSRRNQLSNRWLPQPRSMLLAGEDDMDIPSPSPPRHARTGSREMSYHTQTSISSRPRSSVLVPGDGYTDLPPRLMRARGSETGSLFHEDVWPPPGERSRLADPLVNASSQVDLGGIVDRVMGSNSPGSPVSQQGGPSRLSIGATRMRGGDMDSPIAITGGSEDDLHFFRHSMPVQEGSFDSARAPLLPPPSPVRERQNSRGSLPPSPIQHQHSPTTHHQNTSWIHRPVSGKAMEALAEFRAARNQRPRERRNSGATVSVYSQASANDRRDSRLIAAPSPGPAASRDEIPPTYDSVPSDSLGRAM